MAANRKHRVITHKIIKQETFSCFRLTHNGQDSIVIVFRECVQEIDGRLMYFVSFVGFEKNKWEAIMVHLC